MTDTKSSPQFIPEASSSPEELQPQVNTSGDPTTSISPYPDYGEFCQLDWLNKGRRERSEYGREYDYGSYS
ncbi:Hypothetical predicted protein [Mytilus galloprovincialis]|uniref:Uncharacterized protein n=1 Tax=Mytilus galloprovincialis TaxID=29158 RepID=A0A8B6GWF1_MYTGA|nr:Hypothetical predicted protein [Mytilus galloprovincialis]